jgi:hypothetical protein
MPKTALQKAKAKLRSRDIRVTVMKAVIIDNDGKPVTGEIVGVLVPDHPIDRRSMKERRFHVGKQLRATLRQDRNPKFWGKAHILGGWLADNVEWCQGLDMHSALKKLQERSGIGCETVEYEIPGVGKLTRTEAISLNFDDMDEGEFSLLWDGGNGEGGWIGWLRREVFGGLDAASREEVELIIARDQGA